MRVDVDGLDALAGDPDFLAPLGPCYAGLAANRPDANPIMPKNSLRLAMYIPL